MQLSIEIESEGLEHYLGKMASASKKEIGRALDAIGEDIRSTAIMRISDTTGRTGKFRVFTGQGRGSYYRDEPPLNSKYNWGSAIRASADGEYPAADTGFLAKSIIKVQESDTLVTVEAKAEYAGRLEYKLNRPFMKMAIEENRDNILKHTAKAVDRILQAGKNGTTL